MARETIGTAFIRILAEGKDFRADVKEKLDDVEPDIEKAGKEHGRTYAVEFSAEFEKNLKRGLNDITNKKSNQFDIGRLFGKGSRNNFLNFIGSTISNMVDLVENVGRAAKRFVDFGKTMAAAFTEAGGGFKGFTSAISAGGSSIVAAAGGMAALGAAAAALVVVLPVLVSVGSLLVGVITALAASITFALLGAVSALAALLLPLAAGIAVVTAAALSLSDSMKKDLTKAIKPLRDELKALGRIAAEEVFRNAPAQAKGFATALDGLRPLVRAVGRELSGLGDDFVKALNSKGFDQFKANLTLTLPAAVRGLGRSIINSLGGVGGLFTALAAPGGLMERTVQWLEKITTEFTEWANSASGQADLKKFFKEAGDSAADLGGLLKQVTLLLSTLFAGSKDSGDNLITDLADAAERFRKFLEEDPDAVKEWAKDAQQFAENLGDLAVNLGKVIDLLDNPVIRKFTTEGFKIAIPGGAILLFWKQFVRSVETAASKVGEFFGKGGPVQKALGAVGTFISDSFQSAMDWITQEFFPFFTSIPGQIGGALSSLATTIGNAIQGGFTTAQNWITGTFIPFITGLPNRILFALGALAGTVFVALIQGFINAGVWITGTFLPTIARIPGQIVAFFVGSATFIRDFFVTAYNTAQAWITGTFIPWVLALPGRIAAAFRGTANFIREFFVNAYNSAASWITGTFLPWVRGIPVRVANSFTGAYTFIRTFFINAYNSVVAYVNNTVLPWVRGIPGRIASAFAGIGTAIGNGIAGAIRSALNSAVSGINSVIAGFNSKAGKIGVTLPKLPTFASGGIVGGATALIAGEAGREAIVPLDRPLSQVDPAVRELAAFAQGKLRTGSSVTNNRGFDVGGITIVTPVEDPRAVAQEVVNRLAAAAYI